MPFQSEKQRRYMHANLPDIANRWEAKYGLGGVAGLNSQLNSLPEYYLPKNQGGFIPSHQAGIYGLAEGGSIAGGHQIGTPIGNRTGFGNPFGYSDAPAASSSSSSGGGDAGHLSHNVPVSLGGTKPDTKPTKDTGDHRNIHRDTGKEEEAYVVVDGKKVHQPKWGTQEDPRSQIQLKGDEDIETIKEIEDENALRKLKYDTTLTKNERETLEVGLGLRDPKPKRSIWKTIGMGAAIITGVAPLLGIQAPAAIQTVAQLNALHDQANSALATFNMINKTDYTLEDLYNKVTNVKNADKKIINALPRGHPERIQKEGLKKTVDVQERDGVNIKYTTEEITDTNDANADKAALEQKYQEMDEASYAAWLRQQEMQAKKEAYLKNFRHMYMSAQGGRVPSGYNTGGLSNLFRLKNV